jgi:hypothetical protein
MVREGPRRSMRLGTGPVLPLLIPSLTRVAWSGYQTLHRPAFELHAVIGS